MRNLLFISLATTIACQDIEDEIVSDGPDSEAGNVEEGEQESQDESQGWQERDDFAGGLGHGFDGVTFLDQTVDKTDEPIEEPTEEAWGSVPMAEGQYLGTIEMIYANTCDPVAEGDTFDTRVRVNSQGETVLGGGLFQANGDNIRVQRIREAEVEGTVDCVEVESLEGNGTMFNNQEMEFEFHINVSMVGSDCPIVDPCSDNYLAYMELMQD